MTLERFQRLLGGRLAALRKDLAMSQDEASQRAGLTRQHLQRIEGGTMNPTVATVFRLAKVYKVSIGELMTSVAQVPAGRTAATRVEAR
jgi:transcriptional regulator with XRE-family HTH domain